MALSESLEQGLVHRKTNEWKTLQATSLQTNRMLHMANALGHDDTPPNQQSCAIEQNQKFDALPLAKIQHLIEVTVPMLKISLCNELFVSLYRTNQPTQKLEPVENEDAVCDPATG